MGVLSLLFRVFIFALVTLKTYLLFTVGRCNSKKRLDGKVIIVTGATSGIGKETARELVNRGAKVILACRNTKDADEVANEFRKSKPKAEIVVKRLDLCDFDSVRAFANEILKEEKKLDILVNNAGISNGTFKTTIDGFEETYQANYLGPFLLTELLLPLLKKSTPSRIINTGSLAYVGGNFDVKNLDAVLKSPPTMKRYRDTKLAMLMWTRAVGEELKNSGVTINVVHPGVVYTQFGSSCPTIKLVLIRLFLYAFGRSAKDGAQTLLHLCLDSIGDTENGQYWAECVKKKTSKGNDPEVNAELVKTTRKILGL